jgi:small subunit ribosomal protein S2
MVGTKYQTSDLITSAATKARCHYVNKKWVGGMLTNWSTIKIHLQRFRNLEDKEIMGLFN